MIYIPTRKSFTINTQVLTILDRFNLNCSRGAQYWGGGGANIINQHYSLNLPKTAPHTIDKVLHVVRINSHCVMKELVSLHHLTF